MQLKFARLDSDYLKFLYYSSIKDEKVRDELVQKIYPSSEAVWRLVSELGANEKFPIINPLYRLYDMANQINYFDQMSAGGQTPHIQELKFLGMMYPAALEEAQGIEGLDMTEFREAGEKLAQLQAQYPQSQN